MDRPKPIAFFLDEEVSDDDPYRDIKPQAVAWMVDAPIDPAERRDDG